MGIRGLKSVYTYSDFREYLRDYFLVRCGENTSYSYRQMAKELGFPSPNYIKLIIDGKRRLGLRSLDRLLEGLGLRGREKKFFAALVDFCQARRPVEKQRAFGKLVDFRQPLTMATLTPGEYRYYNEWYHCVVRELIVRESAPVDFEKVAGKVFPRISVAQVNRSVELLVELGLIEGNGQEGYAQTSCFVVTDREVTSIGVRNHHAKMMELATAAMDTVDRDKREISSATVSVSSGCLRRIKQRVQEFEDEILRMAREDRGVDRVYQLNVQLFPLSQEERNV